ncbi:V-type ATP synthase subunit E [Methanoplanus endosymbiosus]|uniref:A-type ATP synthase subunit E n=1 Tax=Methanoplanus endosymbiosus TaxID=33865 RepID=A0A9E7PML8_9EURY|nr:V-type ATP synthase subunit E [Methanoplanus endosymbiosus]UUX92650.1 V-type ATP synthase subunit E [Methanoplanus endosymbiosus]
MSAEAIMQEIRREAEERVAAVKKEAEEKNREIINEARREAEAEYAAVMKEGLREIREEERRLISLANLEANELVRQIKEKGISNCFSEAERILSEISSSGNYPAILARLIEEGKAAIGEDELFVLTRREDRELVKGLIPAFNGLNMDDVEIRDAGVVLRSARLNIRIDQTFPERLKRLKKRLTHDTAVMLYDRV